MNVRASEPLPLLTAACVVPPSAGRFSGVFSP
jgi:hypothetical protein